MIALQRALQTGYKLPARYHREVRHAVLTTEETIGGFCVESYLYSGGYLQWDYSPDGTASRTWTNNRISTTEFYRNGILTEGWLKHYDD